MFIHPRARFPPASLSGITPTAAAPEVSAIEGETERKKCASGAVKLAGKKYQKKNANAQMINDSWEISGDRFVENSLRLDFPVWAFISHFLCFFRSIDEAAEANVLPLTMHLLYTIFLVNSLLMNAD